MSNLTIEGPLKLEYNRLRLSTKESSKENASIRIKTIIHWRVVIESMWTYPEMFEERYPSRDRYYDFKNIFAEKFSKQIAFLAKNKANFKKVHNIGI
jgi:hypothetical protein